MLKVFELQFESDFKTLRTWFSNEILQSIYEFKV